MGNRFGRNFLKEDILIVNKYVKMCLVGLFLIFMVVRIYKFSYSLINRSFNILNL